MKKWLVFIVFTSVLLIYLSFMYLPLLNRPKKIVGIYDIEKIINKIDKCNYFSLKNKINFSGTPMNNYGIAQSCSFPGKYNFVTFCNYHYTRKFPFSGFLRIDHCLDTTFHGIYTVKWSTYEIDPPRMKLSLESSEWLITLIEMEGFSKYNMVIESGIEHTKLLEFMNENKPFIWKECNNDH